MSDSFLKYYNIEHNYFAYGAKIINLLDSGHKSLENLYSNFSDEISVDIFIDTLTFLYQADLISFHYTKYIKLNDTN